MTPCLSYLATQLAKDLVADYLESTEGGQEPVRTSNLNSYSDCTLGESIREFRADKIYVWKMRAWHGVEAFLEFCTSVLAREVE